MRSRRLSRSQKLDAGQQELMPETRSAGEVYVEMVRDHRHNGGFGFRQPNHSKPRVRGWWKDDLAPPACSKATPEGRTAWAKWDALNQQRWLEQSTARILAMLARGPRPGFVFWWQAGTLHEINELTLRWTLWVQATGKPPPLLPEQRLSCPWLGKLCPYGDGSQRDPAGALHLTHYAVQRPSLFEPEPVGTKTFDAICCVPALYRMARRYRVEMSRRREDGTGSWWDVEVVVDSSAPGVQEEIDVLFGLRACGAA